LGFWGLAEVAAEDPDAEFVHFALESDIEWFNRVFERDNAAVLEEVGAFFFSSREDDALGCDHVTVVRDLTGDNRIDAVGLACKGRNRRTMGPWRGDDEAETGLVCGGESFWLARWQSATRR